MLKKSITYLDYNNEERTEDFYFNLNQAELLELELGVDGGLTAMVTRISAAKNVPELIKIFKSLILKAYGEKSADGKRFVKSDELSTAFAQTEAYSQLFMELATNDKVASDFVNGIVAGATINKESTKQPQTTITQPGTV